MANLSVREISPPKRDEEESEDEDELIINTDDDFKALTAGDNNV